MTLNCISLNFQRISWISQISGATTASRMKIDLYCQRQRCKHVESEQFLACFRVARVCQRQLGFLVLSLSDFVVGIVFPVCMSVCLCAEYKPQLLDGCRRNLAAYAGKYLLARSDLCNAQPAIFTFKLLFGLEITNVP